MVENKQRKETIVGVHDSHPRLYKLADFMKYPNFSFKFIVLKPFTWSGDIDRPLILTKFTPLAYIWVILGACNLLYHSIGLYIYLLHPTVKYIYIFGSETVSLIDLVSENCSIFGLIVVASCKMYVLFFYRHKISQLLEEFERLFPNEQEQMDPFSSFRIQYYAEKSNRLMKRTTGFFIFAFFFYNLLPIIEFIYESIVPDAVVTYRYQSNTWYPWHNEKNTKTIWNFIIVNIFQVYSSLLGVALITAGEFILCFFLTQLEMHFDYLSNSFERLNITNKGSSEKILKRILNHHGKLLKLSHEINNIFNGSFLVNFATASVAICLMGLSMLSVSPLKYSVGLLTFLIFTQFICYSGSEFTETSGELSNAGFHSEWYHGSKEYCQMMLFFLLQAKKPNVVRVYKYTTVSMSTFMAILKLSYQLFTFFKAMN